MSIPDMGNDFQPFPPPQSSERRISQGDPMSFPQSTGDDLGQDWSQWMRWDEETFPETAKDLPPSPFAIQFTSPSTSAGQKESVSPQIEFSPHISLDNIIPPFESFLGADRNGTVVSETNAAGGGGIQSLKSTTSSPPISSTGASRKRKSGSQDDASTVTNLVQDGKKVPSKKRAHNIIEKRYRANLNEKIAELRDSVPSLRASKDANGDLLDDDDAEGVTSSNKLNKASILSKATEYIRHLEMRNKRLEEENTALKNRLRQVDKAADQNVTSAASVSSPSTCTVSTESGASSSPSVFSQTEDPPNDPSSSSLYPPEGLIKVPESFKRMRSTPVKDASYSQSYIQYQRNDSDPRESGGGPRRTYFPNKYMLGALAGLMVLEGMGTEKQTESTEKGLLAIPINLLKKVQLPSHAFWETSFVRSFWYSWHAHAISHFLILAVLIVGSAFGVFVYLFNAEPRRQYSSSKIASVSDATFLSASNFRRQAWLTSMQRVGVPQHVFFHEWYVVTSRCFEYVLRCILGWKLYSWATGIAEEDDKGRVKTWDIAIDAQLAGGDAEISKSRLVLTIFASGTLPRSPRRMMLKALHLRILLWRVGVPGSWSFQISNNVARILARYQWNLARKISRKLSKDHPDALPGYLASLLKFDSEDVMIDSIMQRAANLTWNRPSHEGTDDDEALLDIVEEDPAIQSSLDALAAWWSSHLLQRALLKYFEASSGGPDMKKYRDLFKSRIKIALDVAPQPSAAHTRALVMKAVFFEQDRVANIGTVLAALPKESGENEEKKASNFLDSSLPMSVRKEISVAVRCAMIATIFTAHATGDTSLPAIFSVQRAIAWFNKISLDPVELTLLEFAAVYHLLRVMALDAEFLTFSDSSSSSSPVLKASDLCSAISSDGEKEGSQCSSQSKEDLTQPIPNLGRVASELIYWARNAYNPAFYGFTTSLVRVIETECKSLCQRVGVDIVDSSCAQEERSRAKRLENTKTKGSSEPANKDKNEAIQGIPVPCLSPENCSDDDIGDRSPKSGCTNTPTDKVPNLAQAAS